jgi:carboxyl-terminal processing protease
VDNFDVRSFKLTDKEYDDFCRYIDSQDIPYESETRRALGALERAVERERYDDSLNEAIATLKTLLKDDKMSNMETYRDEIEAALLSDVILRYAYSAGVIERSMVNDNMVNKAVELLLNSDEYERILREQDLEMH